ncbi:MAG: hypothetical protein ACODAU_07155 [Myxococcota bacterium]
MARPSKRDLARTLLRTHGRTFAEELRIPIARNTPAPLFQLLYASLLFSARISAENAAEAARALIDAGLTTPRKMAGATWQERVDVITWHGYKRYDERTATMLGDMAERACKEYGGDLRRLRDEARRDPKRERELLQRFKGIGPVGADIFLREIQGVWREVYPYADGKVLKAAGRLGLGDSASDLTGLVARRDFPRLVAALVRVDLEKAYDEVRSQAA